MRRITSGTGPRSFVATLLAAAAVTAFAALGAIAVGGGSVASAQYQYGGKVAICHVAGQSGQRVTITVAGPAVPAHLAHGDTLGPCP